MAQWIKALQACSLEPTERLSDQLVPMSSTLPWEGAACLCELSTAVGNGRQRGLIGQLAWYIQQQK